jgi:hypothetical protein
MPFRMEFADRNTFYACSRGCVEAHRFHFSDADRVLINECPRGEKCITCDRVLADRYPIDMPRGPLALCPGASVDGWRDHRDGATEFHMWNPETRKQYLRRDHHVGTERFTSDWLEFAE